MPISKRMREYVEHLLTSDETGFTDKAWAEMMGIPPDTVKSWKKRPDVQDALEAAKKEYDGGSVFGRKSFQWALEEALVNYQTAKDGDNSTETRHWHRIILGLTEPEARSSDRVDYSQWTDEDLEAEVFRRGLTPTEAALDGLKGAT